MKLHFLTFSGAAQGSIGFISPPQTKNPGENVTLVCTVTNPDKLSVSWYKDSNILTLDSVSVFRNPRYTISVDKDSYSLHVSWKFDIFIVQSDSRFHE